MQGAPDGWSGSHAGSRGRILERILRTFDFDSENRNSSRISAEEREPEHWRDQQRDLGDSRPLDSGIAQRLSHGFGRTVPDVRVHSGPAGRAAARSQHAPAFSVGREIVLDEDAIARSKIDREEILAHEVAHVMQRARGGSSPSAAHEYDATSTSVNAVMRGRGADLSPAAPSLGASALSLHRCTPSPVEEALKGNRPFTADLSRQALQQYRGMSASDRDRAVARYYPTNAYHRLLQALPPADASGPYTNEVQDMEQRIQRLAGRSYAAAHGLADENAMVQAQTTLMQQRNLAQAQAAVGPAPTPAQIAQQQPAQVAQTSIPPSANVLTPAQVTTWENKARNVSIPAVVAHAAAHHPELALTAADFHVDVVAIENRGQGVVAQGTIIGGRNVCVVGRPFVELVDRDPAYVMSAVQHELHGHPEYGPYGTPGSEYGLDLYDRAAARMPGYVRPVGPGRTTEVDSYAYQETEIYSLLRSMPYHTAPTAAHAAVSQYSVDPASTVRARIGLIKSQWAPTVAQALLRGLYQRLRHDPRITPAALDAFRQGVRAHYTGADASIANEILL